VSSRAVRASLQSQPVLYNAAGKKIKEQVLNQRFKVQGFTSGVPIVQVVQIVHDGNTFYTACADFRTSHRGGNEDAELEKF
jgi:hypothetical protein